MTGATVKDVAPPPTESDCEKADNQNTTGRGLLHSSEKTGSNTVSSMVVKQNGSTIATRSAFSRWSRSRSKKFKKFFVRGQPMNDPGRTTHPDKPGVEQCGAFHKHKKRPGRHKPDTGCDAEARLLYTYAKRQSKEPLDMVFKIDWRNADGNHAIPCPDCFRMMCHAKTNCNVKIYVCNKENRPIELDNECENDDYEGFTRRINKMGGK